MDAAYRKIKLLAFDFDGVFTDNYVYVDDAGREQVRCSRADGLGLQKLRERGLELLVVSTEKNPVVSKRCEKLKLQCFQGIDDKAVFLKDYANKKGIDLRDAAFVGNDENDLTAMKIVGFPFAVNDAYPKAKKLAKYVTKKRGGEGAVREICDAIDAAFDDRK